MIGNHQNKANKVSKNNYYETVSAHQYENQVKTKLKLQKKGMEFYHDL